MSKTRSICTAALLTALTTLAPFAAHAAPSAKEKAEARTLVTDAKKAAKDKKWSEAVTALKRAQELDPKPETEIELAQALAGDKKLIDAAKIYRALMDPANKAVQKPMRDQAKKALEEVEAKVPFLQVDVTGTGDKKAVTRIDGNETDAAVEVALDPGDHKVEVSAEGFEPQDKTVHLNEGAHEKVSFELKAKPVEKPPEPVKGSIIPGAVGLGVGGAALIVGGVFGGLAFAAASDAKALCKDNKCPSSAAADIDRSKLYGNVSTGMLVAGGAIATAGIVLIILRPFGKPDPAKAASNRPLVTPWIAPGYAGLGTVGVF